MSISSNIWKLYVIKSLKWFMLIMPIIVLFFQENGLTLKEVMILQGIYSFIIAVLEIPSGYIGDVFGRKNTLILGSIGLFIGYLIISLSFNFWYFFIGEIILGIGSSFISGTDSAILYDSLVESKREKEYSKVEGISYGIGNYSEAIAGVLGGIIAETSLRLTFEIQVIIAGLIIPITILLIEPKIYKEKKINHNIKSIFGVIKFSIINNKLLKWLIIFSSSIGFATLTLAWFIQPYFKTIGIPLKYFGMLWAFLNLTTGFSSFNAYKTEKYISRDRFLLLISFGISLSILFISISSALTGLVLIFIVYILRGLGTPILRTYINNNTPSNIRATVLSIRSFCIRISFAIVAPLIGWIADNYSLAKGFFVVGIIVGVISLLSSIKLKKLINN